MFQRGSLGELTANASKRALQSGALQTIPTEVEFVEDGGVSFLIRIVARLADQARVAAAAGSAPSGKNPFLPYGPSMYVADVSESHVALLNKFNVVDRHLLIVTRQFERQEARLNRRDFAALWKCLVEYDSLGFYNAGATAGASQPHKHLQLVPLPLASGGPETPISPLLETMREQAGIGPACAFPFRHAVGRVRVTRESSLEEASHRLEAMYRELLGEMGLEEEAEANDGVPAPYNLLVTRRWMLLTPRKRDSFESISVNALGFAGALLVRNTQQLATLKSRGPMTALKYVVGE